MATIEECYEQNLTSPGGSTPQSSSRMATHHPSRKLSKLDEPDMQDHFWRIYMRSPPSYHSPRLLLNRKTSKTVSV